MKAPAVSDHPNYILAHAIHEQVSLALRCGVPVAAAIATLEDAIARISALDVPPANPAQQEEPCTG